MTMAPSMPSAMRMLAPLRSGITQCGAAASMSGFTMKISMM